jgi:putative chitinase
MITLQQIISATPVAKLRAAQFLPALNAAMDKYGINTPLRQAAFLAQCFHESGCLACVEENLNYRAETLMRVWPKRFPTLAIAQQYAGSPVKLANKVYADRMGNGPEASGDGYRFRGAGLIQLTGKQNQSQYALQARRDVLTIGEYLRTPEGACDSAAWFWQRCGATAKADLGDFDGVSDLINIGRKTDKEGDAVGYADRLRLYNAFKKVLGA